MVNDVSIISGIIIFFIASGIILPFVNDSFGGNPSGNDVKGLLGANFYGTQENNTDCTFVFTGVSYIPVCYEQQAKDSVNAFDVLISIGKMFFWTFGDLPVFIDLLIYLPLRIILLFLGYRAIRGGSG